MKKFAALAALAAVLAFAAPVFAATNPFMDVPMNHWAYDAIGQLAAHGILSGYPDGTYKGKQPTTRYELASALARSLAVVDMTKASKQDVEMLKKLVIEFKDELEALGVKVAELDDRVALLEERLGGWKLSGALRLQVGNNSAKEAPNGKGYVDMNRAWVRFERWFGDPDNPMHFVGILSGGEDSTGSHGNFREFFVEVPFFMDSTLVLGRIRWDAEAKYYITGDNVGGFGANMGGFIGLDSVLTDRSVDALAIKKSFGIGNIKGYVSHVSSGSGTNDDGTAFSNAIDKLAGGTNSTAKSLLASDSKISEKYSAWELFGMGEFQFTEKIGFDLGFQGILGDNAESEKDLTTYASYGGHAVDSFRFKSLWSVFAGLRFNFTEDVAFKAIYYYQKHNIDFWTPDTNTPANYAWREPETFLADGKNYDSKSKHWAVMFDVSQNLLKFTSAWLEYGQYDQGFVTPRDGAIDVAGTTFVPVDMKYWRIALAQKWNDKWATHLFYYGYKYDYASSVKDGKKPKEFGLGVQYTLNPNVIIGLNYAKVDFDTAGKKDDNKIRLRTQVTF